MMENLSSLKGFWRAILGLEHDVCRKKYGKFTRDRDKEVSVWIPWAPRLYASFGHIIDNPGLRAIGTPLRLPFAGVDLLRTGM
jgi:hypothetical protein